ncbi:MAG: hypothetical protein AB7V45_03180 [Candidatus Krumholzibacteriia bacterium]
MSNTLPIGYASTLRTLIRFAIAMAISGILIGIAYQESAKKLPLASVPVEVHQGALAPLSLVHGHVFTLGVFLPLCLAGAMVLARRSGGRPVGPRAQAVLTRGFLPFAAATVLLQLFKGYFVLLAVRHGQHDLAVVDAGFMGGSHAVRFAVYAVVHAGMGITLAAFLIALWRSLGKEGPA